MNRPLEEKFNIVTQFPNTAATIQYVKADGTPSVRTITHIKPPHRGKNWHVSVNAYDMLRGEFRTFRLDRMTGEPTFYQMLTADGIPHVITL